MTLWAFFSGASLSAQQIWVSGYYGGWSQWNMPPDRVDYSALTHLLHFSVIPNADGTLDSTSNSLSAAHSADMVSRAHAAGVKVILAIGGENTADRFRSAAGDANRAAFINNLVNFMTSRGYDGIDVDWEDSATGGVPDSDVPLYSTFITALRSRLNQITPRPFLTAAAIRPASLFASLQNQFDQINVMTYNMAGPWSGWPTWHNAPLYNGDYRFPSTGQPISSVDGKLQEFLNAGIAAQKLGIGIPFFGVVWSGGSGTPTGGVTEPRQQFTVAPTLQALPYYTILRDYYQSRYERWDETSFTYSIRGPQVPYLRIDVAGSTGDKLVSYDNERSVQKKVEYARSKGIGGTMLWNLGAGYVAGAALPDPLLQAVKRGKNSPTSSLCSQPLDRQPRALWTWDTWDSNLLTDSNAKQKFFDFAQTHGVRNIYLNVYSKRLNQSLVQNSPTALANFITDSATRCMEVELLFGNADWSLTGNQSQAVYFAQQAVSFANSLPGARPVGLHFDVEPYLLAAWTSDMQGTANQYLNLLEQLAAVTAGKGLRLTVDIPFWFDERLITRNALTRPLNQWILDTVDRTTLMDYRDTSSQIISLASAELSYAQSIAKPTTLGVETNCGVTPTYVTFCEEGASAMEQAFSDVYNNYRQNPSFGYFAVEDYEGYSALPITLTNAAPIVATPASASPNPVGGTTTSLSVLGADDGGEAALTYNWATTGAPPAPVTFGVNGTNAAKNTTAAFTKAGSYTFQVTLKDAAGLTAASNVTVTVNQTLTTITLSPPSATVPLGGTQQFAASALDQFGAAMAQPPAFTWTAGGGTVSTTGLYTAGSVAGTYAVTAAASGKNGSATITLTNAAPIISDFTAPTIEIISPADDSNARKNVSIKFSASDDVGIARVELWEGQGTRDVAILSLNQTQTFDPPQPTQQQGSMTFATQVLGYHTFQMKAYDTSGNVTSSRRIQVKVVKGKISLVRFASQGFGVSTGNINSSAESGNDVRALVIGPQNGLRQQLIFDPLVSKVKFVTTKGRTLIEQSNTSGQGIVLNLQDAAGNVAYESGLAGLICMQGGEDSGDFGKWECKPLVIVK
ncbi:MAG: hypothetical protein HY551_06515 [Elusimicrobia bacterium]|nr:hypothetical protein [Elusimicrobiota bacterium]